MSSRRRFLLITGIHFGLTLVTMAITLATILPEGGEPRGIGRLFFALHVLLTYPASLLGSRWMAGFGGADFPMPYVLLLLNSLLWGGVIVWIWRAVDQRHHRAAFRTRGP